MRNRKNKQLTIPTAKQIETEILREKYNRKYKQVLKSTVYSLIVVAAVAVLIATLAFPVLQISGSSMEPTLNDEEIVVLLKTANMKKNELCCFSYQNKLLIKRVIGLPGDKINIDVNGNVFVNDELIDEPYVTDKALGECDITFPCYVTDNHYFVLGDHRSTSIDSRSSVIGLVSEEFIVGKIFFRIWPFESISFVD
ncbi:MAG: signal peptidase I [Acutalibacteraceae bacterium]|nr:signal peptidase I [Acutalibacteraceae bacterium]